MKRPYDITITATIELNQQIFAESGAEAVDVAKGMLRDNGAIGQIEVERCIFLDDEEIPA